MKKFVINLKRRPDRLESFKKQCPIEYDTINVIHGFDGKNVSLEESARERNMVNKFNKMSEGEIGVFISHLRIYQLIIKEDIPLAFIMEDDAIFCNDFITKFNNVEQEIPSDTSILFIGGRFTPDFRMRQCSHVTEHIVKHINIETWNGNDMDRTFHAYIISKELAEACINEFYGSTIINNAIDHWILKVCIKNSLPIYNAQPHLCYSPMTGDSDIRASRIIYKIK